MIYIVTYQLIPNRKAKDISEELQKSPNWWHYLDYTWLIQTNEGANQLYSRITPHLKDTDRVLIAQFMPNAQHQGWLPQDAWDWINQNRFL